MNQYASGALVAFVLLAMGVSAVILGGINYKVTERAKTGVLMWNICWSVFFWNAGYGWMSLCYDSEMAYIARGFSLFFIGIYLIYILRYAATVSGYKSKSLALFMLIFAIAYFVAWSQIIQKSAVEFKETAWGYWYTSNMSWARMLQFASIIAIYIQYYYILAYGRKHKVLKREKYVLKQFGLFGPILFLGFLFDTVFPTAFDSPAIPGSSISAFVSAMVLFRISTNNKLFGLTKEHVSEYVFKDVKLPVIVANHEGNIVLFNDITSTFFGLDNSDITGKKLEELIEVELDDIAKIKSNDKVCILEQTDVNDKFGDMLYSIYFLHDVTKERQQFATIQASQRMAENANKAKSEFLANMSHEIRTPINAVLGMDEMILRECEDEAILEYADNIKNAGNLLLSLINDILDFSKIENGKMEVVPAEYELSSMINDLYIMSRDRAAKKGLALNIDVDSNIPNALVGDDVRIRQVITNLITNAIKYTQVGKVDFSVSVIEKSDKTIKLRFNVTDTGMGIREEDKERMFAAFQRVDENINRNVEGTGLGLSITMSLLKLMDSTLVLNSVYGEGSEFYFDIEQEIADASPIGDINKMLTKHDEKREEYKQALYAPKAKILVVDDNSMNIKIVQGLLKKTGVQISTAMSGYEALNQVRNLKFDVIFMDHMMPGMDGIETVAKMHKIEDYPSKDAVIIALTANAVYGAREMFLANGFDEFLSKPVKGEKLEEMLIEFLPKEYLEDVPVETPKEVKSEPITVSNANAESVKEDAEPDEDTSSLMKFAKSCEMINVEDGINLCMEDPDFYEEVLKIYTEENELESLAKFYAEKDLANYEIKVHGVKSTSKNIGANGLYDEALALEMAAKGGDADYIEAHHQEFLDKYKLLINGLSSAINN